jgi:hypothetical protein
MPHAVSVPVRQMILARHRRGHGAISIAEDLDLSVRTVRHLLLRLQDDPDALLPSYGSKPVAPHPLLADILEYRRLHPAWGAELIRAHIRRDKPNVSLPCARTVQRWLRRSGLSPAPPGRKVQSRRRRAENPHEVLQLDAAEKLSLLGGQKASWLRLVDECSGAFLHTRVFPLGAVERGANRLGARAVA